MALTDLDRLQEAHPLWFVTTVWTSVATGPDYRRIVATRGGVQVHGWDYEEMSARLAHEEALRGWPCTLDGPPIRQV
jgi:hypothetical protein